MATSAVECYFLDQTGTLVEIVARGGTRRQRGAAIGAHVRAHADLGLQRYHISYSETYGFNTATWARYNVTKGE